MSFITTNFELKIQLVQSVWKKQNFKGWLKPNKIVGGIIWTHKISLRGYLDKSLYLTCGLPAFCLVFNSLRCKISGL